MTVLRKQLTYFQSPKERMAQNQKMGKKLEMAKLAEDVLGRRMWHSRIY